LRFSICDLWGVLPKSFGPRLDLGAPSPRSADPISRNAATDANGFQTKESFAYFHEKVSGCQAPWCFFGVPRFEFFCDQDRDSPGFHAHLAV
jgi:hypothetical protein